MVEGDYLIFFYIVMFLVYILLNLVLSWDFSPPLETMIDNFAIYVVWAGIYDLLEFV